MNRERTNYPSRLQHRSPIRPGRSGFGSRVDAPPRVVCDSSNPSRFTPPLHPGPGPVPLFKYPSSNCGCSGDDSWKPGLPPLPQRPALGCPWAPWPERNVEPPRCPLPSGPLGTVSVQRHAWARVRLCPHQPTVRGQAGQGAIAVNARSRGRSHAPPRRGDATITVKTNPHPLSPPARLSERPRDAAAALSWRRRPLAGHSTPVGYTQTPRRGAGPGAGPRRNGPIP